MRQKTDAIFIGEKIVLKSSIKKELGTKIVNLEEKEIISSTNNEIKSYEKQKLCRKYTKKSFVMKKSLKKSEVIVIKPENLEELLKANAV